jgi:hypothetical protein
MTLKASEADKLEKVVKRPSLTLVGMSTPSEFFNAIGGGDVASGLLNRFLIVKSEIGVQMSQDSCVSTISDQLKVWAIEHANAHEGDLIAGNMHDMPPHPIEVVFTPKAKKLLREYEERLVDAIRAEEGTGLEAMYNRSREIAMRLSLIITRSMGQDQIGLDAMKWSIDYVEHYATQTIRMFRSNMADGPFDAACKAVFAKIEAAGARGITERDIARGVAAFANMDRRKRDDVLEILQSDNDIKCRTEKTTGRDRVAWFIPTTC